MARFITEADYPASIKTEIKRILTGTTGDQPSAKQITAEDTAIAMIRQYIGGRYDCDQIFTPATGDTDNRDYWMVSCVITIALYRLYHQTGTKDIPEHRLHDYEDVVTWLRKVGQGEIPANLPVLPENDSNPGDIRFNSRTAIDNKW